MRILLGFLLAICKSLVRLVQQQWWRGRFAARGVRIARGVIIEKDSDCLLSIGPRSAVGFGTLLIVKSEFGLTGSLSIGEHTAVNEYNNLRAAGGDINIGNHCQIAQFCTLIATNHTTETSKFMIDAPWDGTKTSINIEDDVWIGANSVILPGVRIGRGAVIGAGSVISRDVPDHSVVAGVPGKIIRRRTLFAREP
jgi:acetyltransferase-like isoleucine patch superfamily enzyme